MRTFFALTLTQALSLIGSRMTGIAVGIWVFRETGDVTPILLTSFFLEAPGMLIAGLVGVLVDRWDRRHVMILGDAGEAVGTSILLVSFLSGQFEVWHLYMAALFKGVFMTLQQPAADAAITMLVPAAHRERANGFKEMAFPLAGVLAPVLAGFAYPWIDVTGIVAIDLTTFVVAVVVVSLLRIPRPPRSEEAHAYHGTWWREFRGGLSFLLRRRALLRFALYGTTINFLLNGPLELSIPYLTTVTGSETMVGVLMGVMSLGALTGAGLIAVWGGTRPRVHTLLPGTILAGLMMMLYGVARSPALLAVAVFLALMPLPMGAALGKSILQLKTPPDMQGRVFALLAQLDAITAPLSFLVTAPLVDRIIEPAVGGARWEWVEPLVGGEPGAGMGLVLLVAGALIVIITLLAYASPTIRHLEATLPDYAAHAADAHALPEAGDRPSRAAESA